MGKLLQMDTFHIITVPPNGPVLFCTLSSVGVVCNARGQPGGGHCTAGQYGYIPLGRRLVLMKKSYSCFFAPSFIPQKQFHRISPDIFGRQQGFEKTD